MKRLLIWLKVKLAPRVFAQEINNLYDSASKWEKLIADAEADRRKIQEAYSVLKKDFIDKLSVVDLVREKMAGFNPRLVDGVKLSLNSQGGIEVLSDIFEDAKRAGYGGDKDFLADCKSLSDNRALQVIFDYVKRNQMVFTTCAARTLEQVHFGGASINGVELVKEEAERLRAIFEERNASPEKFDKHDVV